MKSLVAGVDLNSSPALIPRKLLILRQAKTGTIGENGKSFLHFFYTFVFLLGHLAVVAFAGHSRPSTPLPLHRSLPKPPKQFRWYQD
jgi:hypothetical protein